MSSEHIEHRAHDLEDGRVGDQEEEELHRHHHHHHHHHHQQQPQLQQQLQPQHHHHHHQELDPIPSPTPSPSSDPRSRMRPRLPQSITTPLPVHPSSRPGSAGSASRFGAYQQQQPQQQQGQQGQQGQGQLQSPIQMQSTTGIPSAGGSRLRDISPASAMSSMLSEKQADRDERMALRAIRAFLKARTSYDVLPLSFRLIVFDTTLSVKESLNILIQNSIVSAPLWDSSKSKFAGLLTTSDYINVIQYYFQNPAALAKIDQFRLTSLRVDVIALIKGGVYDDLSLNVGEALKKRSPDFAGIYTCTVDDGLDTILDTIRRSRVHRLIVVDESFKLRGILTLSDILRYILVEGATQDP
ncbi:nuclear protein SNF4 [Ascosphaera apis ARSEF 7405]|uniref:Nuclear protein SNF4 n=1 Tax=Ascosphaera apis ARSEF 7405 TaxID=392613 RepID=A0A166P603_9EURO|nr:nuclear protein SNF4 [Ascosphaera apis ARSEF 7405]